MVWLGIILIIVAVGLIVAEFFTGSGFLAAGGVAALIAGLVLLTTSNSMLVQVNWWVTIPIIILIIAFLAFIVWRVVKTHKTKIQTGKEEMVGNIATVKQELDPEGTVLYEGELWTARSSSGKIEPGEEVVITKVERLNLTVMKKSTL
jgi:membrane-bound serine protease (ClpP class)